MSEPPRNTDARSVSELFDLHWRKRQRQQERKPRLVDGVERGESAPAVTYFVRNAFQLAPWLGSGLGFLVGFGLAAAFLAYDGSQPINVLGLLVITMLGPIALLLATVWGIARASHASRSPGIAPLPGPLRWLLTASLRLQTLIFDRTSERKRRAIREFSGLLRGEIRHLRPVLPWTGMRIAQVIAIAVHLGLLAGLLSRLLFTDLVFGWATTIDEVATALPVVVHALAAPWALLLPGAVPDAEIIAASRYDRFTGTFASPDIATGARDWWAFLVTGTIFWGLVPRAILVTVLRTKEVLAIHQVLANDESLRETKRRLADGPPTDTTARLSQDPAKDSPEVATPRAAIVAWAHDAPPRDETVNRIASQLGWLITMRTDAGGLHYDPDTVAHHVAASSDAVAVFCEPFEPPTSAVRSFLRTLRSELPDTAPVVVVLDSPDAVAIPDSMLAAWQSATDAMADPSLVLHVPAPTSEGPTDPTSDPAPPNDEPT